MHSLLSAEILISNYYFLVKLPLRRVMVTQTQNYPYPSDIRLPIPKIVGYHPLDVGKTMGR
jgi:hypothetical protein